MNSERPESLRPVLKDVEERLVQHISDVCENDHLPNESTGELIKLEETLSMAAEAAKEAISIRRRIRARGDVGPKGILNDIGPTNGLAEEGPKAT
jgi:hypothetical protein